MRELTGDSGKCLACHPGVQHEAGRASAGPRESATSSRSRRAPPSIICARSSAKACCNAVTARDALAALTLTEPGHALGTKRCRSWACSQPAAPLLAAENREVELPLAATALPKCGEDVFALRCEGTT